MLSSSVKALRQEVMLQFYWTLVQPHLEYRVQFWTPHYRKYEEALERVQESCIKMLSGLECINSKERLDKLELFSLEHQRLKLINMYPFMEVHTRQSVRTFFPSVEMSWAIKYRFEVRRAKFKFFFTQRVMYT